MEHMEEIISTIKRIKSTLLNDLKSIEDQIEEIKNEMLKDFLLSRVQNSKLNGSQINDFNTQLSLLYEKKNVLNTALLKLDIQHEDPILKELIEMIQKFQKDDFLFE